MTTRKPFIVGLAGGSGSGKTTLTKIVAEALPWDCSIISLDQFYKDLSHLSLEERASVNFDHPDSLDYDMAVEVLSDARAGRTAQMPVYDFTVSNRTTKTLAVEPAPVIIVEGIHALYELELVALYDLTVFLKIDEATRFERKLERDIRDRDRTYESVLNMWNTRTKPMHNVYVEPTSVRAQMVFTDSFAPQAIEAITATIQRRMNIDSNNVSDFKQAIWQ